MVHQPRRNTAIAALLLCGVVGVGVLLAMGGTVLGPGAWSANAAEGEDEGGRPAAGGWGSEGEAAEPGPDGRGLDTYALPVFTALNRARARADLPTLTVDDGLVESAERDACAIARGELPLSGSAARLEEAGGQRENVGLVVDPDPDWGARTIHEWWTQTPDHRADRMDPDMHRYGVGACVDEERAYYVERFAS